MERTAVAQKGLSPKLLADLIVSLATFALAYFGIDLDPELAAVVAKAAGFLAGVLVRPGRVVVQDVGPASDDLLPDVVHERIGS